jgi:hypothetical protein
MLDFEGGGDVEQLWVQFHDKIANPFQRDTRRGEKR